MFLRDITEVEAGKVVTTINKGLEKSPEFDDVHLVLYTDGGCANTGDKVGGWGVHGYWYTKKPTTSNSGCKGFTPTQLGYENGKISKGRFKANVIGYVDFFSGLTAPTTNNIAELAALIQAYKVIALYPVKSVHIHMDSNYVKKGLTEYVKGWQKRNWMTSAGKPVANKEEWMQLVEADTAIREQYPNAITIHKIEAHSGQAGNDKADELATAGAWGIRNRPDIDSSNFTVKSPDLYWGDRTFHPIFSESRLFFNSQLSGTVDNVYYQSNLPYSGSETVKEQILCKRVSDLLMSVVRLDEPDPVIDGLHNYVVNTRNYTGVAKTRLDTLKNVANYQHLESYPDGRYLIFNDDLERISMPNKATIFNIINPARHSYMMYTEFDNIKEVLYAIEGKVDGYNLIGFDITDYMYDKVPKGKNKEELVNKLKPTLIDSIDVAVQIPGHSFDTLTLTFGIDLPSKLGLNKFKTMNPKITLYINHNSSTYFTYYVHVDIDGATGLWCAPYSNEVLLPTC